MKKPTIIIKPPYPRRSSRSAGLSLDRFGRVIPPVKRPAKPQSQEKRS